MEPHLQGEDLITDSNIQHCLEIRRNGCLHKMGLGWKHGFPSVHTSFRTGTAINLALMSIDRKALAHVRSQRCRVQDLHQTSPRNPCRESQVLPGSVQRGGSNVRRGRWALSTFHRLKERRSRHPSCVCSNGKPPTPTQPGHYSRLLAATASSPAASGYLSWSILWKLPPSFPRDPPEHPEMCDPPRSSRCGTLGWISVSASPSPCLCLSLNPWVSFGDPVVTSAAAASLGMVAEPPAGAQTPLPAPTHPEWPVAPGASPYPPLPGGAPAGAPRAPGPRRCQQSSSGSALTLPALMERRRPALDSQSCIG